MKGVFLAGAGDVRPDQRWSESVGDLARAAAEPCLAAAGPRIDALVVAAAPGAQAALAAVVADRLGLAGRVSVQQVELGDASGAAAVHAACAQVAAGLARCVLVVGVAKVSDLSERERTTYLDALIDQDAEAPLGLTYQALAGVLADLYLTRHGLKGGALAHVTAKNAAAATAGGETFWSHAPTAAELVRDLPVAPPLLRSDFAPILDGATCVLVADEATARELTPHPVAIVGLGAATDLSVVADRAAPLSLPAVAGATKVALERAGVARDALAFWELSSACTILETLAGESLGLAAAGGYGARCKEGLAVPVNPSGGAQGRGFVIGTCGVAQAREAFLQLGAGAGGRQVAAAQAQGASAASVSLGGLGTVAFATVYRRTA